MFPASVSHCWIPNYTRILCNFCDWRHTEDILLQEMKIILPEALVRRGHFHFIWRRKDKCLEQNLLCHSQGMCLQRPNQHTLKTSTFAHTDLLQHLCLNDNHRSLSRICRHVLQGPNGEASGRRQLRSHADVMFLLVSKPAGEESATGEGRVSIVLRSNLQSRIRHSFFSKVCVYFWQFCFVQLVTHTSKTTWLTHTDTQITSENEHSGAPGKHLNLDLLCFDATLNVLLLLARTRAIKDCFWDHHDILYMLWGAFILLQAFAKSTRVHMFCLTSKISSKTVLFCSWKRSNAFREKFLRTTQETQYVQLWTTFSRSTSSRLVRASLFQEIDGAGGEAEAALEASEAVAARQVEAAHSRATPVRPGVTLLALPQATLLLPK